MRKLAALLALSILGACGADGEPVQPSAGANVTLGSDGAHVGGTVSVRKGPLSVGLSL